MPKSLNLHEDRLQAIALLLRWEGEVSNARLRELFGIHFTHASRLIAAFRAANPYAVEDDRSRKRFLAKALADDANTNGGSLRHYLELLQRTGGTPPGLHLLRADPADVAPSVFAPVQQAIRAGHGVDIEYRSMRHPEPHVRRLFPHACVHTQGRWHIRAYCMMTASFRDFVLGRITWVRPVDGTSPVTPDDDAAWHTPVEFIVEPHAGLPVAQADVVRFERFRQASAMVRGTRAALLPYVLHELRVAVDIQRQRPPDYLLMLRNRDALRPWLLDADERGQD